MAHVKSTKKAKVKDSADVEEEEKVKDLALGALIL